MNVGAGRADRYVGSAECRLNATRAVTAQARRCGLRHSRTWLPLLYEQRRLLQQTAERSDS